MKFINRVIFLLVIAMFALYFATISQAFVVAGETFKGSCPDTSETIWVKAAPEGLILGENGSVTWDIPATTPTGTYSFTCKNKVAGNNGKSTVEIDVIGLNHIADSIIGVEGGLVVGEGVSLDIPEDRIHEPTLVSISSLDGTLPLPYSDAIIDKTFVLNPHGISFTDMPASIPRFTDLVEMKDHFDSLAADVPGITLTISGLTDGNYSLITYQPNGAGIMNWNYISSRVTEDSDGTFTLVATLQHFSIYSILYEQQFTHSETWLYDMEWELAAERVEALQEVVEVLDMETDHTFTNYLYNAVTPELMGGDKELALAPVGINDSSTSAYELQFQLSESAYIRNEFVVEVVNTGYIVAGATVPLTHYGVVLSPKNKITGEICSPDCGPGYIVDTYFGDPTMHEIQRHYSTDPDNDGAYWYGFIDKWMNGAVEDHYTVDTFDDYAVTVQAMWDEIMGLGGDPEPEWKCWWEHPNYAPGCANGQYVCNQQNCYNYTIMDCPGGIVAVGPSGECPENPDIKICG